VGGRRSGSGKVFSTAERGRGSAGVERMFCGLKLTTERNGRESVRDENRQKQTDDAPEKKGWSSGEGVGRVDSQKERSRGGVDSG